MGKFVVISCLSTLLSNEDAAVELLLISPPGMQEGPPEDVAVEIAMPPTPPPPENMYVKGGSVCGAWPGKLPLPVMNLDTKMVTYITFLKNIYIL